MDRPEHHQGGRFDNPGHPFSSGLSDLLRFARERPRRRWQRVEVEPVRPEPWCVEWRVTWVGHSTVLFQGDGLNVLTDPIWSERASPVSWAGPRRWAAPGVAFEDLPALDAVLISHDHYDHLDRRTVERLAREHKATFFVPLGLGKWVAARGASRVVELDWWGSAPLAQATVHAVPARHFSGRGPSRNQTLWAGFVLEAPSGRLYFAGDTGWWPRFADIGERFAPIRLAAIPIGAYLPRWFMSPVHIDPSEAVQVHLAVGARTSLAIHHNTFKLADDPQDAPRLALAQALEDAGVDPAAFRVVGHGGGFEVPSL